MVQLRFILHFNPYSGKKKKQISKLQYSESETRYPHSTLSNFGFVSVSGDRKCTRQAVLNMKPNTPSTAVIVGPEVTGDGDQILGLCTFSFFLVFKLKQPKKMTLPNQH